MIFARRKKAKPIVSAAKLWQSLCKEGGIQVIWEKGEPLPSYDRGLEYEISKALFGDASKPLATQLEGSKISTAQLLNAFFKAVMPFSQMLQDIYKMLDQANASAQDKTVRVAIKPEGLDEPLRATLEQFREWEEQFRAASIRVLVPVWTTNSLWAFAAQFKPNTKVPDPIAPDLSSWEDIYRYQPGFASPPTFDRTGDKAFDDSAAIAYETIEWFMKACREIAPDHQGLRRLYDESGRSADATDQKFQLLTVLAQAAGDAWPVGMVRTIRNAQLRIQRLPAPLRRAEASRVLGEVTSLIESLPKSPMVIDGFEKIFSDIFKLPVWKQRNAVYSVWIATQIVAALAPRPVTFHPKDGQLDFGFGGSRFASVRTGEGDFGLWSELRTALLRPTSKYRKHSIQPDYRIVWAGDEKDPASTRVVIECKQYKQPSRRNFTEAVNDYAVSCPEAEVALVNYGPIGTGLRSHIEGAIVDRAHFLEYFLPPARLAELAAILDRAIPAAGVKRSWQGASTVRLIWDQPLQDLDLHGFAALPTSLREVSYRNKADLEADMELSADVTTGPGEETLQIQSWRADRYDIFVHNFSKAPPLAGGPARVEVRLGDESWDFCPPASGRDHWWHVCTIWPKRGTLVPVERLCATPEFSESS